MRASTRPAQAATSSTRTTPRAGVKPRPRVGVAILAAGLLFTVAACSTENSADQAGTSPSTASSPTTSPTAGTATGGGVAAEWLPKLRSLADGSTAVADCQQPSSAACAEAIDAVMEVVDGLSVELDTEGVAGDYPKTVEEIDKLDLAEIQYKVDGCAGDPAADEDGSACHANALAVAMGPSTLEMTLLADDPSAADQ